MKIPIRDFDGAPSVLAFAHDWTLGTESIEDLDVIRAELRALGAVLMVLSRTGIWSFRADDGFERFAAHDDEIEREIARLAGLYGVELAPDGSRAPTVILLDAAGDVRFAYTPSPARDPRAMRPTLAQALQTAGRSVGSPAPTRGAWRERVVSSLAAGFTMVFLGGCVVP